MAGVKEARRFLEQAFYLDKRIEKKAEEIARMKARLQKSAPQISDMPRGGSGADWTDAAVKIIEYEQQVNAEIARLCEIKRRIGEVIDRVEDARYRTLLEMRYRNYYRFEKIAVEMNYSFDRVRHLHQEALETVAGKIDTH